MCAAVCNLVEPPTAVVEHSRGLMLSLCLAFASKQVISFEHDGVTSLESSKSEDLLIGRLLAQPPCITSNFKRTGSRLDFSMAWPH